jgi:NAD(P)H-flavin reductase/hemoglobin-like flavoprotein
MDTARLRKSFAQVTMHGDEVALFFYASLFLRHPELRDMFPVSMATQRDRLVGALGRIISDVENIEQLRPFLEVLGRDHRKFGVLPDLFKPLGDTLIATLAHFSGPAWTTELEAEWQAAYDIAAQIMIDAAAADELVHPPYWDATVLFHERRAFDTAVFRVGTPEELSYLPGQSVAIEYETRPRIWRYYSIANAPRPDGTLDFHVRTVPGGELSMVLVGGLAAGSRLRLGAPVGTLTLDETSGRDVLLVAGSTGLAPVKAIAEHIAGLPRRPRVSLFFGARHADGLYDLVDLEKFSASAPWLTVIPCVSDEADFAGQRGLLPDVVARCGSWEYHDAYLAGPTPMVESMAARLAAQGLPQEQIHVEDFGWSEP